MSKFNLDEIPPASCFALEIEAAFVIDANEALNASAPDLSTGNPNQISITNERNEVDHMAQGAEKYGDEVNTAAEQNTASMQKPHGRREGTREGGKVFFSVFAEHRSFWENVDLGETTSFFDQVHFGCKKNRTHKRLRKRSCSKEKYQFRDTQGEKEIQVLKED